LIGKNKEELACSSTNSGCSQNRRCQ